MCVANFLKTSFRRKTNLENPIFVPGKRWSVGFPNPPRGCGWDQGQNKELGILKHGPSLKVPCCCELSWNFQRGKREVRPQPLFVEVVAVWPSLALSENPKVGCVMGCVWIEGCALLWWWEICIPRGHLSTALAASVLRTGERLRKEPVWGREAAEKMDQTQQGLRCGKRLLQGCLGTMQIQVANGLRTSLKTRRVTENLFLPLAFTCSCSGVLCFVHLSSNTSLWSLRCCYWSEGVRVSREAQAAPPSTRCVRGSSLETRWESESSSVLRAHAGRWARLRVLSGAGQTVLLLYLYIGEMGGQKYSFQSREQLHGIGNLSLRVEESQLVELLIWVST